MHDYSDLGKCMRRMSVKTLIEHQHTLTKEPCTRLEGQAHCAMKKLQSVDYTNIHLSIALRKHKAIKWFSLLLLCKVLQWQVKTVKNTLAVVKKESHKAKCYKNY